MPEVETAASVLADFATKLKDLEERHNLLKERVLLLGQTMLKEQERVSKELAGIKDSLNTARLDLDRLKEGLGSIVAESADFVRKEELKAIERYAKLFEPMRFATLEDVKRLLAKKEQKEEEE